MLSRSSLLVCGIVTLLAIGWIVYAPGLRGGFVFDDFGSLPPLGDYGSVDNWTAFLRYITSGFADPTGRPLSMLTFLVDARNWPADPAPFKRTNVLMHLLNGVLLCGLLLQLGAAGALSRKQTAMAALLGTGLWLLHPLWASTTLYIVQRETMLSGTFVLLGLLCYVHGRRQLAHRPRSGTFWIIGGIGLCNILGLLAKANGILLPVYVLVVEWFYLRGTPTSPHASRTLARCLAIAVYPAVIAILTYLIYWGIHGILLGTPMPHRSWTLRQRLLTEPRVLVEYLQLLISPRPYSIGLFNDSLVVSRDWLHPWSTIPALLVVAALIAAAIMRRKRNRYFALAILFYFAGHCMESTTIPLELYFEHRNYVPAMLLFWPLAIWMTNTETYARTKPFLAFGAMTLLATETFFAAKLWGDSASQALVWAEKNPTSARAQALAASMERSMGRYAEAEARLRKALASQPSEVQLAINLIGVRCAQGSVDKNDLSLAETALRDGTSPGPLTFKWVNDAMALVHSGRCRGLDADTLQRLIDAANENAQARDDKSYQQNLLDLYGRIALLKNDAALARRKFDEALERDPNPDIALRQAATLGSNGLPQAGIEHLDHYRQLIPRETPRPIRNMQDVHAWLLIHDGYWDKEFAHLRAALEKDEHESNSPKPDLISRPNS
ncbi:MAG: tetratricopeptide repeat protein [Rudaea sp.]|uniref:tetratricopeptide repeat protein n=1 Tax=Rudaea sp. TaxID=2136325 RepID=UPI0039E6282C